jgi:hypothetical protein
MADREMSSGLITTATKNTVQYYELVYIGVNAGYYVTNAPFNINYNANDYLSAGALLSVSNITEDISFEIQKLSITISGIAYLHNDTEPFMKEILDLDYTDKPVAIYRKYFNMDNTPSDVVQVYQGYIDNATVTDGIGNGGGVNIQTSNHWANFSRVTGNYTNQTSQQELFAGDKGFEFAKEIQKQIEWK